MALILPGTAQVHKGGGVKLGALLWRDPDAHRLVKRCLDQHCVPEEQFARLIAVYRDHAHKQRRRGLNEDIDEILMAEAD